MCMSKKFYNKRLQEKEQLIIQRRALDTVSIPLMWLDEFDQDGWCGMAEQNGGDCGCDGCSCEKE